MKLLLDTHIWIWFVSQPDRLSRTVQRRIENPSNELFLSPVSIWEAHTLSRRGRVRLKPNFSQWLDAALGQTQIREAPFNQAVAIEACRLNLEQPDPGDLWLAATASVLDLTLVTADRQLIGCSWLKTLANQ